MRSLLTKSSITILTLLALGSSLTLASASSKPGMFLYPLKQTTQRFGSAAGGPAQPLPPATEASKQGVSQQPSATPDTASQEIQGDASQEPDVGGPGRMDEATATPAPTSARVVDEITVSVEQVEVPSADPNKIGTMSSPQAFVQLESSSHDDQPERSNVGDRNVGQADKEGSNENDNSHSESNHEDESNDNGKNYDD
jgi:hypothetical protein